METDEWVAHVERLRAAHLEPAEELFQRALETKDVEEYSSILSALDARGNREVFEVAARYCKSKVAAERALGARLLGQLGHHKQPFQEERMQILLGMLKDKRATVLHAVGWSLGYLPNHPRVVEPLAALKAHRSGTVRYAVAHTLAGYDDELSTKTLIELSEDKFYAVREWATTGLAGIDVDTPEIRAALTRRLNDEDEITASEAAEGLARRGVEVSKQGSRGS